MSFDNAKFQWAREKIIHANDYWERIEPCKNPTVIDVEFIDGAGEVQIGDYTWDYEEDSVTIKYLNDNGEERFFRFEQKFSELLNELICF